MGIVRPLRATLPLTSLLLVRGVTSAWVNPTPVVVVLRVSEILLKEQVAEEVHLCCTAVCTVVQHRGYTSGTTLLLYCYCCST